MHAFSSAWVKVDLQKTMNVGGVIMQGRGRNIQYVTSTHVLYSTDGMHWTNARVQGSSVCSYLDTIISMYLYM